MPRAGTPVDPSPADMPAAGQNDIAVAGVGTRFIVEAG